jgi:hypothetical protein
MIDGTASGIRHFADLWRCFPSYHIQHFCVTTASLVRVHSVHDSFVQGFSNARGLPLGIQERHCAKLREAEFLWWGATRGRPQEKRQSPSLTKTQEAES